MTRGAFASVLVILAFSLMAESLFAADERKGREVYDLHCSTCHGLDGVSTDPLVPNFADGDALFLMDAELMQRINDGNETMPAFRGLLSAEEIRDVIAYIRTF